MDKLPDHYDALSEHDKSFVKSFIYLRANSLCLHCHKPATDIDIYTNNASLILNNGFCHDCDLGGLDDLVLVNVRL